MQLSGSHIQATRHNGTMVFQVPVPLAANCRKTAERTRWLGDLPGALAELARRWGLKVHHPFSEEVSCAWVAPVTLPDGAPAVLKFGMPHMEAEHESSGLRFWDGDPTVRLLAEDPETGAMLLERCEPGTLLRALPELEQDLVIAGLLRRLWRSPGAPHRFRPLSQLMKHWSAETMADAELWPDASLVLEGLRLLEELPRSAAQEVLLATDLHAGNVLRSQREPWLVIDPKPFVGDPAFDATQHLFNCDARLRRDPNGTIQRVSDVLGVDEQRVRLWMFARAAAEPRDDWRDERSIGIAKAIARGL
jgi:streptomycin 6-kinase